MTNVGRDFRKRPEVKGGRSAGSGSDDAEDRTRSARALVPRQLAFQLESNLGSSVSFLAGSDITRTETSFWMLCSDGVEGRD